MAKDTIKDFTLSGAWISSIDPLKIGYENFSELENYRYSENGVERIQGYSKINTTALTTYYKGRNGIQLKTPHTVPSYILVQEYDIDVSGSVIKSNTTAVPNQGDFSATVVHTDAAGAGIGQFSEFPSFNIGYCNEQESCVWAGDEMRTAAFIKMASISGLTVTNPINYTLEINNTLQSSGNTVSLSGANLEFLVGSTRPLKAIKAYVETANDTASSLTGFYWDGDSWEALGNIVDGTKPGTISFAQTGIISFDTTVSTAKTAYIEGMVLYFYKFVLSAGSTTLYHMTVDAPFQDIVDIWDGVYRTCIQFQALRSGTFEDYTLEINEPSSAQYPIVAEIGGLETSDSIVLVFTERQCGINWALIAGLTNNTASSVTIKYWDGSSYTTVGTVYDGTASSSKSLNQSGVMSWNPPLEPLEHARQIFGVYGYAYEITFSATLNNKKAVGTHTTGANSATLKDTSQKWVVNELVGMTVYNVTDGSSGPITANTDMVVTATLAGGTENDWDVNDVYSISPMKGGVAVDLVTGIPAQRTMRPYKFPLMYKNRVMLCGDVVGKEEHRIDYGVMGAPDVYNGEDSSANGQSIYLGGSGKITGGTRIYNRFGASILDTALFFMATSTYLLNGTYPGDFSVYKISSNYGCPAPLTICTAEIGYEVEADALRNIALWLSYQGPVLFDAAVVIPIPGIEKFFDPRKSSCINFDAITNARAWFDPVNMEWNLCIPSGSSQVTNNTWLTLDLKRKRWYQRNVNSGQWPQTAFQVEDIYGKKYIYSHVDTGYLMRLENGTTWDGEDINYKIKSADILPFDTTWIQSRITQFKLLTQIPEFIDQAPTASITISVNHYKNGETVGVPLQDIVISKSDYMEDHVLVNEDAESIVTEDGDEIILNFFNETRHLRKTQAVSFYGWSHQFEFILSSDEYDYVENYSRNILAWAFQAEQVREDL